VGVSKCNGVTQVNGDDINADQVHDTGRLLEDTHKAPRYQQRTMAVEAVRRGDV